MCIRVWKQICEQCNQVGKLKPQEHQIKKVCITACHRFLEKYFGKPVGYENFKKRKNVDDYKNHKKDLCLACKNKQCCTQKEVPKYLESTTMR